MSLTRNAARFHLGRLVITNRASDVLTTDDVLMALRRHLDGDWGEVGFIDQAFNDGALRDGFRLHSVYHSSRGTRFWVITEHDRSATTILRPDEY